MSFLLVHLTGAFLKEIFETCSGSIFKQKEVGITGTLIFLLFFDLKKL
jgi:hypothetical protein